MNVQTRPLLLRQLDRKLEKLQPLQTLAVPPEGWIHLIRKTLNMSLRQLADRLSVTPQNVKHLEQREQEGTVTLATLREAAQALNMKLVYGFIPNDTSLEKMVERKAREVAQRIVQRTSLTMKLEDQENSPERLRQAVEELTDQLRRELPKSLWD
jgi:predicted DNA-binding mobile mystery protein A